MWKLSHASLPISFLRLGCRWLLYTGAVSPKTNVILLQHDARMRWEQRPRLARTHWGCRLPKKTKKVNIYSCQLALLHFAWAVLVWGRGSALTVSGGFSELLNCPDVVHCSGTSDVKTKKKKCGLMACTDQTKGEMFVCLSHCPVFCTLHTVCTQRFGLYSCVF